MSILKILASLLIAVHIIGACIGMAILSMIQNQFLQRKLTYFVLCWILPFFGFLAIINGGRYMPKIGKDDFALALQKTSTEVEFNREGRPNAGRDSGYSSESQPSSDGGE